MSAIKKPNAYKERQKKLGRKPKNVSATAEEWAAVKPIIDKALCDLRNEEYKEQTMRKPLSSNVITRKDVFATMREWRVVKPLVDQKLADLRGEE